jgi:chromosome partitioning protein
MITITLSNQKGGVAKTTTSGVLAAGLCNRGYRVLAVDLDPQCNLCMSAGIDMLQIETSLYDVFKGTTVAKDIIVTSDLGYDVLPGGLTLAGADMEFTKTGREFMLSEALSSVSDSYDYCVIDNAPTLGILTVNALTAAKWVIVPLTADVYSLQGLSQLNGLIQNVKKYCNKDIEIAGLLLTKFSDRTNVSKALKNQVEAAANQLNTKMFKSKIRESVAIREAALLQTDIFKEAPKANATIDYGCFIDELLEVIKNGR